MDDGANEFKIITFRLGNESYGVDISRVREINSAQAITELPGTADAMLGVVDMRGQVVPIIDLRKGLGLPASPIDKDTRIIVLQVDEQTIGCVVDSVDCVMTVSHIAIQPAPDLTVRNVNFITGIARIADRLVILMDMSKAIERLLVS